MAKTPVRTNATLTVAQDVVIKNATTKEIKSIIKDIKAAPLGEGVLYSSGEISMDAKVIFKRATVVAK